MPWRQGYAAVNEDGHVVEGVFGTFTCVLIYWEKALHHPLPATSPTLLLQADIRPTSLGWFGTQATWCYVFNNSVKRNCSWLSKPQEYGRPRWNQWTMKRTMHRLNQGQEALLEGFMRKQGHWLCTALYEVISGKKSQRILQGAVRLIAMTPRSR